jgi:acetyl-CoA carboxylase biotin carboxyl carrier protein
MFKLSEIRDLIKLMDQTSIQTIEIENENGKLVIKKPEATETQVFTSAPLTMTATQPTMIAPQVMSVPAANAPQVVAPAAVNTSAPATEAPVAEEDVNLHKIVSPMVGTFYRKPSPDKPSYVEVGDRVQAEKVVCIVEAMKLMNEILAEVSGEIVKILVEDGQLVEYGQPLFLVKKDA